MAGLLLRLHQAGVRADQTAIEGAPEFIDGDTRVGAGGATSGSGAAPVTILVPIPRPVTVTTSVPITTDRRGARQGFVHRAGVRSSEGALRAVRRTRGGRHRGEVRITVRVKQ